MTRTRMAPIVPPAIAPVLLVPVTPSGSGSAAEGRDTDIMCACMLMCAHLYIHLHACLVHHQCHYTGHRLLQNGCSSIWIKVCPRAITRFLLPSCFLHSSQQWGSRDTEYIIRIISQSCVILKPAVVPCALNADIPPPLSIPYKAHLLYIWVENHSSCQATGSTQLKYPGVDSHRNTCRIQSYQEAVHMLCPLWNQRAKGGGWCSSQDKGLGTQPWERGHKIIIPMQIMCSF